MEESKIQLLKDCGVEVEKMKVGYILKVRTSPFFLQDELFNLFNPNFKEMEDVFVDSRNLLGNSEFHRRRDDKWVVKRSIPQSGTSHLYAQEEIVDSNEIARLNSLEPFLTLRFHRQISFHGPNIYMDTLHQPLNYRVISVVTEIEGDKITIENLRPLFRNLLLVSEKIDRSLFPGSVHRVLASLLTCNESREGDTPVYFPVYSKFMFALKCIKNEMYMSAFQENDEQPIVQQIINHLMQLGVDERRRADVKQYIWFADYLPNSCSLLRECGSSEAEVMEYLQDNSQYEAMMASQTWQFCPLIDEDEDD